ncbi:1,3-beta-glucanosyltransferase gas1 [Mortierella sp. GBA30]|nr:1,3-beta-glucanosyltransferase gas1 [Mortierella sp. GBA30]
MVRILGAIAIALAATSSLDIIVALNPIITKGSKFFDSVSKEQFFIKGVAYQPKTEPVDVVDPLSRPNDCKRDFALMKALGLNTIRVYQVDASLNHDECMKALADAGIYLMLDLTVPKHSIVRNNPEYDIDVWNNARSTVAAFMDYSNTLGFFVGNEVSNDVKTTVASVYVKALLRDTKTYISTYAPRKIPVGYANNDDADIRLQIQAYFNCDKEEALRIDFFGINLYEWCGANVTYQTSGYAERTKDIAAYSIPVFLSEFGCNLVLPRSFSEVKSIFGPDMQDVWSGGIVYEWSQEENSYGLVQIQPDHTASVLPDYNSLQKALMPLHPKGVNMDAFTENRAISTCPANTATWEPSANLLPPTPSTTACECMMKSLTCIASDQALAATENIGKELNVICGLTSCDDIGSNGKAGVYGKYSYCSPSQKLSYMYNHYYTNVGRGESSTCNFNGMAILTTTAKATDEGCSTQKDTYAGSKHSTTSTTNAASNQKDSAFGLLILLTVLAYTL